MLIYYISQYGKSQKIYNDLNEEVIETTENEHIKNEYWERFRKFLNENIDKSIEDILWVKERIINSLED